MKTVAMYTLGCKVNQYETQAVAELFAQNGFELVPFTDIADIYVINSCVVTSAGEQKTRQAVHRARRQNPGAAVVLCGCYPQAFTKRAVDIGADITIGNTNKADIIGLVKRYLGDRKRIISIKEDIRREVYEPLKISRMTERTRAYLKIEDGCDRQCAYCIVPRTRGNVRSRPIEDIAEEAARLRGNGYKEIILTGINLSAYGTDTGGTPVDAVRAVTGAGVKRIRLGSLEPDLLTDEVITDMAGIPQLCRHFHVSLQSGCDATLARMNRPYTAAQYKALTEKLRSVFPGCAVTTDIIVGFPGETEEEFTRSLDFVKSMNFSDAHIFVYSQREGTPAAGFDGQVEPSVKKRRSARMEAVIAQSRERWLASQVGKRAEVLWLDYSKSGQAAGVTDNNVTVKIKSDTDLQNRGNCVMIVGYEKDYCVGEYRNK